MTAHGVKGIPGTQAVIQHLQSGIRRLLVQWKFGEAALAGSNLVANPPPVQVSRGQPQETELEVEDDNPTEVPSTSPRPPAFDLQLPLANQQDEVLEPLVIEKPATDKPADCGINLAKPADGGIDLEKKLGIGHQVERKGTHRKASNPGEQELPSAAQFKLQKVLLIGLGLAVLWTIARSYSDSIGRVPVSSSAMRSVGYSESRLVLEIEFTNGAVYQYYDVPKELHAGLMTAPSHGRYFNQQIKNAGFRYRRIE